MSPKDFITFMNPEVDTTVKNDLDTPFINMDKLINEKSPKISDDIVEYDKGNSYYYDKIYPNSLTQKYFIVSTFRTITSSIKLELINLFESENLSLTFINEYPDTDDLFCYDIFVTSISPKLNRRIIYNYFSIIIPDMISGVYET